MVIGADDMLDYIAQDDSEVILHISEIKFGNSDALVLKEDQSGIDSGAMYILEKYEDREINLEMWLCDVMLFVFGKFPEKLFIKRAYRL